MINEVAFDLVKEMIERYKKLEDTVSNLNIGSSVMVSTGIVYDVKSGEIRENYATITRLDDIFYVVKTSSFDTWNVKTKENLINKLRQDFLSYTGDLMSIVYQKYEQNKGE